VADERVIAGAAANPFDSDQRILSLARRQAGSKVDADAVRAFKASNIEATATIQQVVVAITDQGIVARPATQTLDADQRVIAFDRRFSRTQIYINACGIVEHGDIETGPAVQQIVAAAAVEDIVVPVSNEGVIAVATLDSFDTGQGVLAFA